MTRLIFDVDDETGYERARDGLIDDFRGWVARQPVNADAHDFGMLLDWKFRYADQTLDQWKVEDLSEFLIGWCPRKLSVSAEDARGLPSTVGLAMSFLADRGLLTPASSPIDRLVEAATDLQTEFMAAMDDPANFGMAKSLFASMGLNDPTELTPERLEQAMAAHNALPLAERQAITGPALGDDSQHEKTFLGPVLVPSEAAVRASTEASPMLAAFRKIADHFGAKGKLLTAKGNIKLADAQALAEILQTGEEYEVQVGDRTFRKSSSTDFTIVDHWQWLAREMGAVRCVGNKLVAVKAWQDRAAKDPVAEVKRGFATLLKYGMIDSLQLRYYSPLARAADEMVASLLARLAMAPAAIEFTELLEFAEELRSQLGTPELTTGEMRPVLDRLFGVLERIGIIEQADVTYEKREPWSDVRKGGTITLTPIGVRVTISELRGAGFELNEVSPPEELTAAKLAGLAAAREFSPAQWWSFATDWLEAGPDQVAQLAEVITDTAAFHLATLPVLLSFCPDHLLETQYRALAAVAESDPVPSDVGSTAVNWLEAHDQLPPSMDAQTVEDAGTVIVGLLAEEDPAAAVEGISIGMTRANLLGMLSHIAQRSLPRAVTTLDAFGAHHPDKVVAKAARKEAFKLRSRLQQR